MPCSVPRPGHRGHHDPVLATPHPGRVSLEVCPHGSQVQRTPPPPASASVIAWAPPPTHPAPVPIPPPDPHPDDHDLFVLVELDRFHDRRVHTQQPTPYP